MPKQTDANTEAQRILAEGKERQAEAVRLQEERDQVTPTPTQEESDLAKLGVVAADEPEAPAEAKPAADTTKRAASYTTRDAKSE